MSRPSFLLPSLRNSLGGPRLAVMLALAIAAAATFAIRPLADDLADRLAGPAAAPDVTDIARAAQPPQRRPGGAWPPPATLALELGIDPVSVTYLRGAPPLTAPGDGTEGAGASPANRPR